MWSYDTKQFIRSVDTLQGSDIIAGVCFRNNIQQSHNNSDVQEGDGLDGDITPYVKMAREYNRQSIAQFLVSSCMLAILLIKIL